MKKYLFTFLFLISFAFSISSQTQEVQKFDEFGITSCDNLSAKLAFFFTSVDELQNSKGYIIVYEGNILSPWWNENNQMAKPRRGEAKMAIYTMKTRIKFRRFDEKRIVFVEGGFREKFTIELWVVPNGKLPPSPTPTLTKMKYRNGKPQNSCKDI